MEKTSYQSAAPVTSPSENIDVDIEYTKLKKDFFPDCWTDDSRMGVLMAPFRPKILNPLNYDNKLKFWKNLISKYCETKGNANITITELKCAFKRNNKKPDCLETVIDDLKKEGKILETQQFMEPPRRSWGIWTQYHIKKIAAWPVNKVKEKIWQPTTDEQNFIVLDAVAKHADHVQKHGTTNKVMAFDDFVKEMKNSNLTSEGAEIALHYLFSKDRACIETHTLNGNDCIIVKLAMQNSTISAITDVDKAIFNLMSQEKDLETTVAKLESDVIDADFKVKCYLKENQRNLAKNHLKRKHTLEANLAKNINILNNIQTLLGNIDDTKHNAKIMEAYKKGADALKNALNDSGLTIDKVDDMLEDVKEVLEMNDEITAQLGVTQFNNDVADDTALEDELKEILKLEEKHDSTMDKSIENRLKQLNLSGLDNLSLTEQDRRLTELHNQLTLN